ncbi:MAG: protein kinase family protein [Firmicutes bacterium]|nr:protein kinase family protein [Bacillota bacterium]
MNRIGQGANGTVYLALRGDELVALKVAEDASALSLEHENLARLGTDAAGRRIGPRALEIDDLTLGNRTIPALSMEYVDGMSILDFVRERGVDWLPVLLLRISKLLSSLHERGYVFGDLKPANILFVRASAEARLIDFGGVTVQGQAVKEFTEMFDRAWWGFGSRKADSGYDVCACALLGIHVLGLVQKADVERLAQRAPAERRLWLLARLQDKQFRTPFLEILQQAVIGNYRDTRSFIQEVGKVLEDNPIVASAVQASAVTAVRKPARKRSQPWDVTDWGLLIAIIVFAITLVLLIWL